MDRGELDARANIPDTDIATQCRFHRQKTAKLHAIIQIPKDDRHPHPGVQQVAGSLRVSPRASASEKS
jgi:hypothetical protein